ncbi:uncharacterized protein LOC127845664 [Dreissena polymorpha]|uniref:C2H2-type domain-containing protein n=1 Tax=Dreissena polymorpha TaxID=45954 RepID=A0A9D4IJ92_DREPO|nr:uncharacterized protein LOC127845664 [Dreissena polymorpha]KAH3775099.1 hypothetical protein DPMN_176496 [Dreissena polymorpha]
MDHTFGNFCVSHSITKECDVIGMAGQLMGPKNLVETVMEEVVKQEAMDTDQASTVFEKALLEASDPEINVCKQSGVPPAKLLQFSFKNEYLSMMDVTQNANSWTNSDNQHTDYHKSVELNGNGLCSTEAECNLICNSLQYISETNTSIASAQLLNTGTLTINIPNNNALMGKTSYIPSSIASTSENLLQGLIPLYKPQEQTMLLLTNSGNNKDIPVINADKHGFESVDANLVQPEVNARLQKVSLASSSNAILEPPQLTGQVTTLLNASNINKLKKLWSKSNAPIKKGAFNTNVQTNMKKGSCKHPTNLIMKHFRISKTNDVSSTLSVESDCKQPNERGEGININGVVDTGTILCTQSSQYSIEIDGIKEQVNTSTDNQFLKSTETERNLNEICSTLPQETEIQENMTVPSTDSYLLNKVTLFKLKYCTKPCNVKLHRVENVYKSFCNLSIDLYPLHLERTCRKDLNHNGQQRRSKRTKPEGLSSMAFTNGTYDGTSGYNDMITEEDLSILVPSDDENDKDYNPWQYMKGCTEKEKTCNGFVLEKSEFEEVDIDENELFCLNVEAQKQTVPDRRLMETDLTAKSETHKLACRFCSFIGKTRLSYAFHMKRSHRKVKCEYCPKLLLRETAAFFQHLALKHTGLKYFKCDFESCQFSTKTQYDLKQHKKCFHATEKKYSCSLCDFHTKWAKNLRHHMLMRHSDERKFACTVCPFRAKRKLDLKQHMFRHTDLKPLSCDLCGFACKTNWELKSHKLKHSSEKPFKCKFPGCNAAKKSNSDLIKHMVVHKVVRDFVCQQCTKSFKCQRSLNKHVSYAHTEGRRFECDTCGLGFKVKSALTKHMVVHSDFKPFQCAICGFRCRLKSNLNSHMVTHDTSTRSYVCPLCPYCVVDPMNLFPHIGVFHPDYCFYCELCRKPFSRYLQLKQHLKRRSIHSLNEIQELKKRPASDLCLTVADSDEYVPQCEDDSCDQDAGKGLPFLKKEVVDDSLPSKTKGLKGAINCSGVSPMIPESLCQTSSPKKIAVVGVYGDLRISLATKGFQFNYDKSGKKSKTWFMDYKLMDKEQSEKYKKYLRKQRILPPIPRGHPPKGYKKLSKLLKSNRARAGPQTYAKKIAKNRDTIDAEHLAAMETLSVKTEVDDALTQVRSQKINSQERNAPSFVKEVTTNPVKQIRRMCTKDSNKLITEGKKPKRVELKSMVEKICQRAQGSEPAILKQTNKTPVGKKKRKNTVKVKNVPSKKGVIQNCEKSKTSCVKNGQESKKRKIGNEANNDYQPKYKYVPVKPPKKKKKTVASKQVNAGLVSYVEGLSGRNKTAATATGKSTTKQPMRKRTKICKKQTENCDDDTMDYSHQDMHEALHMEIADSGRQMIVYYPSDAEQVPMPVFLEKVSDNVEEGKFTVNVNNSEYLVNVGGNVLRVYENEEDYELEDEDDKALLDIDKDLCEVACQVQNKSMETKVFVKQEPAD